MDIDDAQVFIQPSTSVYKENFGQDENPFVQDFQVLVYMRGCQMLRIFQYRVKWNPKRIKDQPMPYAVSASLVGMKMLIIRPNHAKEPVGFFPLINEYL